MAQVRVDGVSGGEEGGIGREGSGDKGTPGQ